MSGTASAAAGSGDVAMSGFAQLGLGNLSDSELMRLLSADEIQPGSQASYQLAKAIYTYHPLGAKMAEGPVNMAQSHPRDLTVTDGPEDRLLRAFRREAKRLGGVGQDVLVNNTMKTARIYGIASLLIGVRGLAPMSPLPLADLAKADLFFNVLDPLNTSGSLVMNQDPASPDFQKATCVKVGGVEYHPSRSVIVMNEQPVYIEYSASAFGYVGRSVYQRALYPLRTFLTTMITDQFIAQKVGLLIHNAVSPGAIANNRILGFLGFKRSTLKAGMTGNVLTIGEKEVISSLNLQNLEGPARFARDNSLQNVAMAAGQPAKLLQEETMVGGMAEGTEDAKRIAQFIDRVRVECDPLYAATDRIVMRRAWSPDFYATVQRDYSEYRNVPYETAFYQWANSFEASWPNLLSEPESEKMKAEELRFKSMVAVVETFSPLVPQSEKAKLVAWGADEVNARRDMFSAPLYLDEDAIAAYEPPVPAAGSGDEEEEPKATPFSVAA